MRSRDAGSSIDADLRDRQPRPPGPRPLVSIVTPTLDRRGLLEEAVESVRSQTYPNIEHIVVDGASADGTVEYLAGISSDRLRWISEPDSGMYDAVNKGLAMARGEILAYLNSDDLYLPWAVDTAVSRLGAEPDAGLVYGDAIRIFMDEGRVVPWFQAPVDHDWLVRWGSLIQPTVFWRRTVGDDIGKFDAGFRNAGDLDYWLRATRRHRLIRVDELLAIDRWHAGAASQTFAQRLAREDLEARRRAGSKPSFGVRMVARLRAAVLRRFLWLRFVAAARGHDAGWPMTQTALAPRISAGEAILGLLPLRPHRGLGAIRWSDDPASLARAGLQASSAHGGRTD